MKWRPGDPRFVVREVEGYPTSATYYYPAVMLSVSVLDAAYNYAEVARFNEESQRRGNQHFDPREAIRNRAAGFAAILEAEHA